MGKKVAGLCGRDGSGRSSRFYNKIYITIVAKIFIFKDIDGDRTLKTNWIV